MTSEQIRAKVREIADKSWFTLDEDTPYQMVYSTRNHGD